MRRDSGASWRWQDAAVKALAAGAGGGQQGAKNAADDLAAQGAAHSADGGFGHSFGKAVATAAGAGAAHAGDALPPRRRSGSLTGRCRNRGSALGGAATENFEGGFTINGVFIDAGDYGIFDELLTLLWRNRADLTVGWTDESAFDHARSSFFIEERHKGLANGEFGDGLFDVDGGIRAEGFGSGFHGFLVLRSKGAKGVLHAISDLTEDGLRNVEWILGDEVYANPFGTDEADNLDDFVFDELREIGEQEMGFIEEKDELGFIGIADFGEMFEERGEEPEKESGVNLG